MIYFFDNYDSLNLERAEELLPAERYEKFCRLKQTRDKENCLAAYLLLKYALKESEIENFKIITGENEKPYLEGIELYFNISHCKFGVAVAVSLSPVGIDVQEIEEYSEGVAKRVFSEEEIRFTENSENKAKTFTRLWTLKEAAAKCDGGGIAVLNSFRLEDSGMKFKKYGKIFTTWERKNLFISVCGDEDFSDIIEINSLEDF